IIGLLNSGLAAAYYLRLALVAVQVPDDKQGVAAFPRPRIGIAVGAALLFAVAASLVMGIYPQWVVLPAAQAGAHTLQAPPVQTAAPLDNAQSQPALKGSHDRTYPLFKLQ
ncbi:MAG: hypothetical protein WBQ94_10780, partial [Terracidiphilus sp.]